MCSSPGEGRRKDQVRVEDKQLHLAIDLIGMRAQATAVGLVQLTIELHEAGILNDLSLGRVKAAIAGEISLARPRSANKREFEGELQDRLDRIFAGTEPISDLSVPRQ